jgi:hypothetical protein
MIILFSSSNKKAMWGFFTPPMAPRKNKKAVGGRFRSTHGLSH